MSGTNDGLLDFNKENDIMRRVGMQRWEREEILGKGTTGDTRTLVEIIIHAHEKSLIRRTRGNSGEAEIRGPPQAE